MARSNLQPVYQCPLLGWMGIIALLSALVLALSATTPAQAQDNPPQSTLEYCLTCHGNPKLLLILPSGEEVSLFVEPDAIQNSVHGPVGMECTSCHRNIHSYPHPPIDFQTRRDLQISYYQACEICHKDPYHAALDSIHAEAVESGDPDAPTCADCHGAHEIHAPNEPRARISTTCGACHKEIYDRYKNSIHGAALIQEDNPDVPVCTDCHGVHNIPDPTTTLFRVETPELCASCHSDPQLMGKYGISSDVYDIYSLSWHGVDVSVYQARWPNLWHQSAVCTDCHGTHDILASEDPRSKVSEQNRLATCQQCHQDAGPKFVSAWTGHNRISLEKTPFVYYTQVFYQSFAYTVLWISAIYVLLQILRHTVQRVRNSLK